MSIPQQILERLGPEKAARRLNLERGIANRKATDAKKPFPIRRYLSINYLARLGIKLSGLTDRGVRNLLDIRVVENEVHLPELPTSFEGFRILQLTDLHCDIHPELMEAIGKKMETIPHDAVVLTGDYHNEILEPFDASLEAMRRLIPHLHPLRFAILGNHDHLAKAVHFEHYGLPVLLNEARPVERTGSKGPERIWFCGIDDPHYYKSHDLNKAKKGIPDGEVTILLSHSPETHREAAALGYHLHLSGHTHGGQIGLPGGIPILHNAHGCRREHISGPWKEGNMLGYTSRGTGAAGVAARFFCQPEMTAHTLRSKELTLTKH